MNYSATEEKSGKKLRQYLIRAAIYTGILLLLLIPTYIAMATYVAQKNAPDESINTVYTSLSLTGPSGNVTTADEELNSSLFDIFAALLSKGNEASSVPSTHLPGAYTVKMKNSTAEDSYSFYFSATFSTCYYKDPLGKLYSVSGTHTENFLNSPYAFELYSGATTPVLTTAATDEVLPSALSWHYRIQKGSFTELNTTVTTQEILTYPIANDIAFYFSLQPSRHEVIIRRGDSELYRGGAEGISLTLQNRDELLDVEIQATYDQDSRLDYYGTVVYRFCMQVVEAAHFTPNTDSVTAGGFFLVRCENVKNVQKLEFAAEPALPAGPILLEREGAVYAVLPAGAAGEKLLHITYGTITATFSLNITQTPVTDHIPDTSGVDFVTLLSQSLPALIDSKCTDTTTLTSLSPQGPFLAPAAERLLSYGDTLTLAGTDLDRTPLPFSLYRSQGNVVTLSIGVVREVGWDIHLGNYVILDHGCGLFTWYGGLSEIYVAKGNVLDRGELLGYAGTTLHRERSVLIMATLGKAPISPDFLCDHAWSFMN